MFGELTLRSRPLRLAFLISPERASLHQAIELNSTLWGGTFNPIIPLYSRLPKGWREFPGKHSAEQRALGYIRAFDPDYIVNCTGGEPPKYIKELGLSVLGADAFWPTGNPDARLGIPGFGVGIFELLNGIYRDLFEKQARFPSKVILPNFPRTHGLFWAALLGAIPPKIAAIVEQDYSRAIDIEKPEVTPQILEGLTKPDILYPLRIARYGLSHSRELRDSYALFMDAGSFIDIVDYWNLRALGRRVIPVPRQFVGVPEFVEFVRRFVRDGFQVNARYPAITYGTRIVRGTSATMKELETFAEILKEAGGKDDAPKSRPMLQHWYPRIWDEWAIGKDGAVPDRVSAQTKSFSIPSTDGVVGFDTIKPDFVADSYDRSPRYANEVAPRFYGDGQQSLANVLPSKHGAMVLRAVGNFARPNEIRISRSGLVHLISWNRNVRWRLPLAEDVFFAWLKDNGIEARLSSCGRLAKEMYVQLGGWLHVLGNEKLLNFLERMSKPDRHTGDVKGLPLHRVKSELKQIDARGNLYESLVERGVFQLGFKTQCSHCQRASWHSPKSFATELICPLCHKSLDAISAVGNKGDWHLRTAGAFSVGKFGDGGYCVLLAKKFLERDFSVSTTPVMSFEDAGNEPTKFEADFGLMWRESLHGESQDGVLFAECKSYDDFKAVDFRRMKALADRFPGAVLAFCTLKKDLKPAERRALVSLCRRGMRQWKTERPMNPVLILTGRELFDDIGAPSCWEKLEAPDWVKRSYSLLELCNATQAIYLGEPHWGDAWAAKRATRKGNARQDGNRE